MSQTGDTSVDFLLMPQLEKDDLYIHFQLSESTYIEDRLLEFYLPFKIDKKD